MSEAPQTPSPRPAAEEPRPAAVPEIASGASGGAGAAVALRALLLGRPRPLAKRTDAPHP